MSREHGLNVPHQNEPELVPIMIIIFLHSNQGFLLGHRLIGNIKNSVLQKFCFFLDFSLLLAKVAFNLHVYCQPRFTGSFLFNYLCLNC